MPRTGIQAISMPAGRSVMSSRRLLALMAEIAILNAGRSTPAVSGDTHAAHIAK